MEPKDTNELIMTEGPISKKILVYALPIFIGYLFQQLYNSADALILGNLVGKSALAAVSSTGSIVFMGIGFVSGFSIGAGIVIARFIGARDQKRTELAVHTTVAMGIVFSIVLSLGGVALSPTVLRLMGTPEDVFAEADLYLRIYFAGSAGLVFYNVFVGILQASGDSQHPLYYLIISSLLNIVLDIIFISCFRIGVGGAALATVISQCTASLLVLQRLRKHTDSIRISFSKIRFDWPVLAEIVRYGLPTAVQNCVIDFSNMLIQSYINSFASAAMAGMGAYSKVEGFAFLPVTAFSMAMSTFISQNRGAEKESRIQKGTRFGLLWSTVIIEIIGVILFISSPVLVAVFNKDPEVVSYGVLCGRIHALFYCFLGFSHVSSAVLRGLGKPVAPMVVMLVCWCAVRVLVLSTLGRMYHNILLACWIYPVTWCLSTIVNLLYLHRLQKNGLL